MADNAAPNVPCARTAASQSGNSPTCVPRSAADKCAKNNHRLPKWWFTHMDPPVIQKIAVDLTEPQCQCRGSLPAPPHAPPTAQRPLSQRDTFVQLPPPLKKLQQTYHVPELPPPKWYFTPIAADKSAEKAYNHRLPTS
ncbi:hypothetical protein JB92DRAFT_3103692 [Gautieria morchelliformis]|nr:hypothetical protein JB92DRAFT_3103692 [Gautieria morchelliformis]